MNLTDGLDGLAIGLMIIAAGAMTMLSYLTGHAEFAEYLELSRTPGRDGADHFLRRDDRRVAGISLVQRASGRNFHGRRGIARAGRSDWDVVAVLLKQEILLLFIGGVYVIEALSVILQVGSFKLRGKRIFKMAPIHHHFEALGWQESKIITRFWIAGLVMALFALTTLKLR